MADTASAVRGFIVENFLFGDSDRHLDDAASLVGEGVVDSTGVLELIEFLESEFEIRISDDESVPANLDSIASIERFVEAKKSCA